MLFGAGPFATAAFSSLPEVRRYASASVSGSASATATTSTVNLASASITNSGTIEAGPKVIAQANSGVTAVGTSSAEGIGRYSPEATVAGSATVLDTSAELRAAGQATIQVRAPQVQLREPCSTDKPVRRAQLPYLQVLLLLIRLRRMFQQSPPLQALRRSLHKA